MGFGDLTRARGGVLERGSVLLPVERLKQPFPRSFRNRHPSVSHREFEDPASGGRITGSKLGEPSGKDDEFYHQAKKELKRHWIRNSNPGQRDAVS
jgi:hypothetical protein